MSSSVRSFLGLQRLLLAGLIFFASPSTESLEAREDREPREAKSLRIGMAQEFHSLNYVLANTLAEKYVLYFIYRPLVYLHTDGTWKPLLAQEIPSLQNGTAKVIGTGASARLDTTWKIRDKAKWGDGAEVTCRDLKLGWEVAKNERISSTYHGSAGDIESVTWNESSPKKCQVLFRKNRWNFYHDLPHPLPSKLEDKVYRKFADEPSGYEKNTTYLADPTQAGLYNGPYIVTKIARGDYLILEANPHFYGSPPKIKRIIIRTFASAVSLQTELLAKGIDMTASVGIPFDQASQLRDRLSKRSPPLTVLQKPSNMYAHIDFNLHNSTLKDLKVRQALSHALDKKELLHGLLMGEALPAEHWLSPNDPLRPSKAEKAQVHDQKTAKELLTEAGWIQNQDGIRRKGRERLTLVITAASGIPLNDHIEAVIQAQWRQVGVDLQIKNVPARQLFSELLPHRKFDLTLYAWSSTPEESPKPVFHSQSIPTEQNAWSGQNIMGWNRPRVDDLIHVLTHEFSFAKRKKAAAELVSLYLQDLPSLPLFFRPDSAIIPQNLKNFSLTGQSFLESIHSEDWDIEL